MLFAYRNIWFAVAPLVIISCGSVGSVNPGPKGGAGRADDGGSVSTSSGSGGTSGVGGASSGSGGNVGGGGSGLGGAGGGAQQDGSIGEMADATGDANDSSVRPDGSTRPDAGLPPAHPIYTPPPGTCAIAQNVQPQVVTIASGSLADAQAQIDAARAANAKAVLLVKMSGTYTVTSAPLKLPSSTCLVLSGTLQAGAGATANALLLIDTQSKVAVAGGTFDGGGAPLNGIRVQGSRKINIDGVTVKNAGHEGIAFAGPGATVWDGGSALTRCEVSGSTAGISVSAAVRVLVLDGFVHDNMGPGIAFDATAGFGAIVENRAAGNATGIQVDGADNAITDNTLTANGNGIVLGTSSSNNSCLQNTLVDQSMADVRLDGTNNLVYANTSLGNATPLAAAGTTNYVVPEGKGLAPGSNKYFYPPTIENPHTDPAIVSGKMRTDITISGGTLVAAQMQYDAARKAHPNDFIVVHMNGAFTHTAASFTLSSYTSILLNGTIDVTNAANPVMAGTGLQFVSISGGTIDGHGMTLQGISLELGSMVVLHKVMLNHFGVQDPRSESDSIHLIKGSGYTIVRGCKVDVCGGRAIWFQEATSRFIVVGNTTSHANMDGIDFDSHTANSLVKDNVSDANTRSGLFLEEGAAFDKAYRNVFSNSPSHGINVYSNAADHMTNRNVVFGNQILNNGDGIRVGAINANTTSDTFAFDNVITGSKANAIQLDALGAGNYCSNNVLSGNKGNFGVDPMGGGDFFDSAPAP